MPQIIILPITPTPKADLKEIFLAAIPGFSLAHRTVFILLDPQTDSFKYVAELF